MPLDIAYKKRFQNDEEKEWSPLLLEAPSLHMQYCGEEDRWKEYACDGCLQDMFELSNSGTLKQPYVFLPTGCSVILFFLQCQTSACYLYGPLTTARRISVPAGGRVFCVRMKPGWLNCFGERLTVGLENQGFPLKKYFTDADILLNRLNHSDTFDGRCNLVLAYLKTKSVETWRIDPLVEICIRLVDESRGQCRVHHLAEAVSRSERFLARTFRDTTRISMKMYCEIVKFQCSFYSLLMTQPRNMTSVIKDLGYYDLPHMNRAYRKFVSYTASDMRYLTMDEIYVSDLLSEGLS